jgi:two-component system, NarL family, response regulator DevR
VKTVTVRVLIVDDHAVVRLGLKTLLAEETDIQVVAEAENSEQALIQTRNHLPEVVVLDIQLPDQSGIDTCRKILSQFPQIRVVMLTSYASELFLEQAVKAGASGYVLKQVGNEELVRAIKAAALGEMAFDTKTTSQMVNRFKQMGKTIEENTIADLSPREIEVMLLVAEGESNKEIGIRLHLSEITIRNYVSNILSKLQLRNRIEIATFVLNHNMTNKE